MRRIFPSGTAWRKFPGDLYREINNHNNFDGAAALGFWLTLAIFPALLFLLALLPFLPIANLDHAVLDLLTQALPGDAAKMLSGTVREITLNQKSGLLSLSFLGTIWATTSGTYAIMQQLNTTYGVKEARSYLRLRLVALALTLVLGTLMIVALILIVLGGQIQDWMTGAMGANGAVAFAFAATRWLIVTFSLLTGIALAYYVGPDVEQKFIFITPGSILATIVIVAASMGFRVYVTSFAHYDAMYGSIGAVVVLMLWLYVTGFVLLIGSEVNSLLEHYSLEGKSKGEKLEPAVA